MEFLILEYPCIMPCRQAVLAPYTLTGLTLTQVARLFYRALDSYHTWTSMSA